MKEAAYVTAEDSVLLRNAVKWRTGNLCLEIGTGNAGGLAVTAGSFGHSVGTDIVRPAMDDWKDAGTDFVLADRATCFRDGVFDLVFFNPPYIRSEGVADPAVDAGSRSEVPSLFLAEALRAVKSSGTVTFLVAEQGMLARFTELCRAKGFGLSRVSSAHLFYEALEVYEASA